VSGAAEVGALILVVGPSGVGKDTLLAGACLALAADPVFGFARRDITRAADAGGENHREVSPAEFNSTVAAGGYLLHWTAHGLSYGLPASLQRQRDLGGHVVANGSRAVLAEARARLAPVRVVVISAPTRMVQARLVARGRESVAGIEARVSRAAENGVPGADVIEVVNDGTVAAGIEALVAALRRI
jgi:phosphonate metabolism protein PhnN/1,5-bisphosphokinase (PRPP-forming)